jgi:hypothetical protein
MTSAVADRETVSRERPSTSGRRGRRRSVTVRGGFEIRVRGRLSERARAAFPDMHVTEVPAETVISGSSQDDDEVHGVLERIQSLGLRMVSLSRDSDAADAALPPRAPRHCPPGPRRSSSNSS